MIHCHILDVDFGCHPHCSARQFIASVLDVHFSAEELSKAALEQYSLSAVHSATMYYEQYTVYTVNSSSAGWVSIGAL